MRWLRFEMKGMVDVKFIFIDKRKEEYYAGCFYFLYTKTCVNYLQLRQAKKWSLKLSKFEQFHIQWHTPLASLLGLNSHFAGPVQKSIGFIFYFFIFYFLIFSDFQRCQSGNEEWRLWSWLKINLHDKFSYWTWNEFYITFFFLLHFFRGILWQFSSCISVLYYILNEYIEEVYLHVVGYELKYPIQLGKDMK